MSATPRPWSLDTFEPMSNDHSQWETCTLSGAGTPGTIAIRVRIENAALIVAAVNAYDALKAENVRLKASLNEVLVACAAALRVMAEYSLADDYERELRAVNVADGFGSRATAALRGEKETP